MAEIKVEKRVERAGYKPGRLGKSAEFAKYSRWNIKNTNLKANVWPEDATCTDDCKVSSSAKNRSICNLELASTALLGDRLYINGGIINKKETTNGSPFFKRSTLHRLLWIDLDKNFHWDNPPIGSIEKPKEIRDLFHAGTFVMDADTELLHTFGGYKWADDASMNDTAVVTQGLWLYNATASLTERWVPKIVSTSWNPLPKAGGMQWASDGETGVAYGMGGSENAEIEFRSKDRSWKKMMSTNPRTINTGGFLHHIPVGSRTTGSLILFGGEDRDRRNRGPSKMNSMSNIWIYDTQNDVWHKQTAIGSTELSDIPDERSLGCSVVAPAPDNSSINIYVYGGTSQNYMDFASMPANASHGMKVALKDDIWVLSIPSFTWTKVHEGSKSLGSFKMSCQRLGRYMVSVGGSHGSYSAGETCKEPINVFDLESLTWNHKKWESNSDYQVPRVISNVIGGGSHGGATLREPKAGWSSPGIKNLITKTYTPCPPPSDNKFTILGSIFGALIFVLLAAGFFILHLRKMKQLKKSAAATANEDPSPTYEQDDPSYGNQYPVGYPSGPPPFWEEHSEEEITAQQVLYQRPFTPRTYNVDPVYAYNGTVSDCSSLRRLTLDSKPSNISSILQGSGTITGTIASGSTRRGSSFNTSTFSQERDNRRTVCSDSISILKRYTQEVVDPMDMRIYKGAAEMDSCGQCPGTLAELPSLVNRVHEIDGVPQQEMDIVDVNINTSTAEHIRNAYSEMYRNAARERYSMNSRVYSERMDEEWSKL